MSIIMSMCSIDTGHSWTQALQVVHSQSSCGVMVSRVFSDPTRSENTGFPVFLSIGFFAGTSDV